MKEGYCEIELMDVVKEAGGREHLLMYGNEDKIAHELFRAQERLITKKLKEYYEVGELHTVAIWNYADKILEEAKRGNP